MIVIVGWHGTACSRKGYAGGSGGAGRATEGWQDKSAHIALRSVGCFCWSFALLPHIGTDACNVWRVSKALGFQPSLHVAELGHG